MVAHSVYTEQTCYQGHWKSGRQSQQAWLLGHDDRCIRHRRTKGVYRTWQTFEERTSQVRSFGQRRFRQF